MPLRPEGVAQLNALLGRVVAAGAAGAAQYAREDAMNRPGSGIQHPGQPNPSSAPDQYPSPQTGQLRDSISSRTVSVFRAEFGSINGPGYGVLLEFKPISAGGRPWATMLSNDPLTHQAIVRAVKEAR